MKVICSAVSGSMPSRWRRRCSTGVVESRTCIQVDAVHEHHALLFVNFLQADFDDFGVAGRDGAADESGFDGQFAMAAIDQDAHANAFRAPEIEQAVHGGAGGASGVENVVDQHDIAIVHYEWNLGGLHDGLRRDGGEIVAIERDIERADGHFHVRESFDRFREALRQRNAAAAHADQRDICRAAAFFHDFMGQPLQGAIDFFGGEQLPFFDDAHWRVILTHGLGFRESGSDGGRG